MQFSSREKKLQVTRLRGTRGTRARASRANSLLRSRRSYFRHNVLYYRIGIALVFRNFGGEPRKITGWKLLSRPFQQRISKHVDEAYFPMLGSAASKQVFARQILLIVPDRIDQFLNATAVGRDRLDD